MARKRCEWKRTGEIAEWIVLFIVVLCPLIQIPTVYDSHSVAFSEIPKTALIQVGIAAAATVCLAVGRIRAGAMSISGMSVLLFLCWMAVSIIWATHRTEAFRVTLHWSLCAVGYYLVVFASTNEGWLKRLQRGVAASLMTVSVIGCAQYFFGLDWFFQTRAPGATFGYNNIAAHAVAVMLPFAAMRYAASKGRLESGLMLFACAVGTLFILVTGTRAAWVAVAVCGLGMGGGVLLGARFGWISLRRSRSKWIGACAAAAALAAGVWAVSITGAGRGGLDVLNRAAEMGRFLEAPGKVTSGRNWIWANSLHMAADRPLTGYGAGNFKIYYPLYQGSANQKVLWNRARLESAHNDYLQLFIELGAVGFCLWIGVILAHATSSIRWMRRNGPADRYPAMGLWAGMAALMVVAFFSFPLQRPLTVFYFFLILGAIENVNRAGLHRESGCGRATAGAILAGRPLLLAASVLLLTGLAVFHARRIAGEHHHQMGFKSGAMRDWDRAYEQLQKSDRLAPHRARTISMLSAACLESGRIGEGIAVLEEGLEQYPYHLTMLFTLAQAYASSGRLHDAEEPLRRILAIHPNYLDGALLLSEVLHRGGKADRALNVLEQCLSWAGEKGRVYYRIGALLFAEKRYAESARNLKKAISLDPDHPQARELLDVLRGRPARS